MSPDDKIGNALQALNRRLERPFSDGRIRDALMKKEYQSMITELATLEIMDRDD